MTFQKENTKKNSRKNNMLENNELNRVNDVTCNFFERGFTSGQMYLWALAKCDEVVVFLHVWAVYRTTGWARKAKQSWLL